MRGICRIGATRGWSGFWWITCCACHTMTPPPRWQKSAICRLDPSPQPSLVILAQSLFECWYFYCPFIFISPCTELFFRVLYYLLRVINIYPYFFSLVDFMDATAHTANLEDWNCCLMILLYAKLLFFFLLPEFWICGFNP